MIFLKRSLGGVITGLAVSHDCSLILDGRNADGQGFHMSSQSFVFHNCSTRYSSVHTDILFYLRSDNAINKVDVEKMEVAIVNSYWELGYFFCIKRREQVPEYG